MYQEEQGYYTDKEKKQASEGKQIFNEVKTFMDVFKDWQSIYTKKSKGSTQTRKNNKLAKESKYLMK